MSIFGSFARGNQNKKSNIDIGIEFAKNSDKNLLYLVRIGKELTKVFKEKVELGIFSSLNPYIIEDIKKEMKILYEKRQNLFEAYFGSDILCKKIYRKNLQGEVL